MDRRYGYYWSRIAACMAGFALLFMAVARVGDSWWQLVLAALLGMLLTQFGFLGHDAAHRQIFASAAWNDWTARVLSGAFAGLSYGWWRGKHNRHHATPNQEGRDPDIVSGLLAFTRDVAAGRTTPARGWFLRHQGWLFFPLLTLEGLNLTLAGVRHLTSRRDVPHRWTELSLIVARLSLYVAALLVLLTPVKALAFFLVQMAVFGLCLGASFAPNHKGMPIVPHSMKLDFLQRQVLMSRNVRGGVVVRAMMGGLNYQIEHHLFPSMPRPNLRHVQPVVRQHCATHGVPYTEVGVWTSYGIVVDYLNHVGLRARGPFDCPLAGQLGR
ncbi:acyl-CoA desaturase [Nocardioides sp. LMS-CY]|uniref:fatty acid desaturase family protein n=1 Tax=Nocardioides sp. (strain LMS-CY) TaxID=2840457 RepID=UPI00207A276C|nr:acyl-CoA desaturase [Nocardioides sp. LMS-CY]